MDRTAAQHLIKRTYNDLHWEGKWASAVALERLTLFGLVIVAGRPVRYGPIDANASRQLLIEHGLVGGDLEPKPAFLVQNEELLEQGPATASQGAAAQHRDRRLGTFRLLRPAVAGRGL